MKKETGFFDKPRHIQMLQRLFYAGLALTIIFDFLIKRKHVYFPWELVPGFYAAFGFGACFLIIKVAKTLGYFWLTKEEDYYE